MNGERRPAPSRDLHRLSADRGARSQQLLVAAIASGPTSMSEFSHVWPQRTDSTIWRLVLANRLRVETEAEYVTAIAVDPSQRWELRRMGILAAAKLPFERALAQIVPSVLAERSPFTLDTHPSLQTHSFIAALLLEESKGLRQRFVADRQRFVGLVRDIVDGFGKREYGVVPGEDAATWLYERLAFYQWETDASASTKVLNELHIPIVQAAALRGLRLTGNYGVLEDLIKNSDSVWLLSRALIEWKKERRLGVEEHDTVKKLVDSNPIGTNYCPQNIIKSTTPSSKAAIPPESTPPKPERRVLSFPDIAGLIRSNETLDTTPLVIAGLTRDQFLLLVEELSPERDYPKRWVPSQPNLGFTATGFTVQGARAESIPSNKDAREKLRPALAAANCYGVIIPWHVELLRGNSSWSGAHASEAYSASLLRCLHAQGQPERLYEELARNGELLFPLLYDIHRIASIQPLLDARAVPFLLRYVNSGTDTLFESMCWLASHIETPEIDPVLEALFTRWIHRFNLSTTGAASAQSFPFWHAFGLLRKHPRFSAIPNFDLRLVELLRHEMAWFHKRDLVDALSESPRSYICHETMLFHAVPFEHFLRDEVDRLEDYADRLFHAATE